MKLHLPALLLSAVLAVTCVASAETSTYDLGNVMYVGDSITHGIGTASYRWALHKIFVDNGISYNEEGVITGNSSGGVAAGTVYGGVTFQNVHSAQASARAYEIAGRTDDSSYGRFGGSNIMNWLGQSTTLTKGGTYSGATFTGDATPDTYFLMIGTNDILSDKDTDTERPLNDVKTIVAAMQKSNANAKITILSMPCWAQDRTNLVSGGTTAAKDYNTKLKAYAATDANITYVDINKGMLDVTKDSTTDYYGVSSMFRNPSGDGIHPTAQGDLLIAGNLAKALGYGGRTAGKTRKDAAEFATIKAGSCTTVASYTEAGFTASGITDGETALTLTSGSSLSYNWNIEADTSLGFTVDFDLQVGNGATDGWNTTDAVSITVGNGSFAGVLNVNEAYIKWGDTIIYSDDMSANKDSLRISYIYGKGSENLSSGYYIWLDDMLIGEALGANATTVNNGVTISSATSALLSNVALDATTSYAPTTTGLYNSTGAYKVADRTISGSGGPGTDTTWAPAGATTGSASDVGTVGTNGATSGDVAMTVSSLTSTSGNLIGNDTSVGSDEKPLNYYLSVEGGGTIAGMKAVILQSGNSTLVGDAHLRLKGEFGGVATVFGAFNGATIKGNSYIEIDTGTYSGSWSSSAAASSFAAAYKGTITGNSSIVVNGGTFSSDVNGGSVDADSKITGKASLNLNGGTFAASVYGGGRAGSIGGGVAVAIDGASVAGTVYGGSAGATITGNVAVTISTEFSEDTSVQAVYGGGTSGTINGNTSVTVSGGSVGGAIYGGGAGDTIKGNTSVTLKGGTYANSVYGGGTSGSITGTSSLTIDGATCSATWVAGGGTGGTIGSSNVQLLSGSVVNVTAGSANKACTISGDTSIVINGGTVTGSAFGGSVGGNVGGSSSVTMNGGTIKGSVYGGGGSGNTTVSGDSKVTLLNGTVGGSVYGGAESGKVSGSTTVVLGGGDKQASPTVTITGNVYGAGVNASGNSTVEIRGNEVAVKGGTINAGASSGSVSGDTKLLISGVESTTKADSVANATVTLSGGTVTTGHTRTLSFENTKNDFSKATLTNFDVIEVKSGSDITLSGLGGATKLAVDDGATMKMLNLVSSITVTELAVTGGSTVGLYTGATAAEASEATITLNGGTATFGEGAGLNANLSLVGATTLTVGSTGLAMGSSVTLGDALTLGNTVAAGQTLTLFSGVDTFTAAGQTLSSGAVIDATSVFTNIAEGTISYENGNVNLMVTPEPATATLSLLALAGLAARRRRK